MYSSLLTAWTTTPFVGVDFRGSDIRYNMVDSAEACRAACDKEDQCQFYTYVMKDFHDLAFRYSIFCATPLLKQNNHNILKLLLICAVGAAAT